MCIVKSVERVQIDKNFLRDGLEHLFKEFNKVNNFTDHSEYCILSLSLSFSIYLLREQFLSVILSYFVLCFWRLDTISECKVLK